MYDKGNNLRIEVTINNPKDFKVLKEKEVIVNHEKIETEKVWLPMGKSITNLYRYVEISKSITKRYIDALPTVDSEQVSLKELEKVSTKIEVNNRSYSGFNLLQGDTICLFQEIASGKYIINGFTNKMIRKELYEDYDSKKNINKTTRLLAKLKAHGIIKKVAKKNKYYLTSNGRKLIDNLLLYTGRTILS